MKISVVIPVYNGAAFIERCVNSVRTQSHPPHQIVVVNDGSTDDTADILRDLAPGVQTITQPNRGRSAARNAGLRAATGDYAAFLDADDVFVREHLACLAREAQRTGAEIVHDDVRIPYLTAEENKAMLRRRRRDEPLDHLYRFQLNIQTSMIQTAWQRESQVWFSEGLEISEDALFYWCCILLGARIAHVPAVGAVLGIHASNTTRDLERTYAVTVDAYRRLEQFIRARKLDVRREARRKIEMGKMHAQVLCELAGLYREPRREYRERLRRALLRPCLSGVDRARCLAGQFWPAFPGARHPAVLRALFGYGVMRAARGTPEERIGR